MPTPADVSPAPSHPRRVWRLRSQLIAVVIATALALVAGLGLASTLALRSSLIEQVDDALVAASSRGEMTPGWGDGAAEQAPPEAPPETSGTAGPTDGDATGGLPHWGGDPSGLQARGQAVGTAVVEAVDGVVLDAGYIDAAGAAQDLSDTQAASLLEAEQNPTWVTVPELGTYRAIAVERADGTVVVTALPWQDSADTLAGYVAVEVIVGILAVAVAALLATVLVRRALRPLDRVAATATRVSELTLDRGEVAIPERVPTADTDSRTEVGQVGAAINRMLGHVEASLSARHDSETRVRQFVADASHELRTPLASIRGYSELVLRRGDLTADARHDVGRVASEGKRMQGLVEDLLLLARLDAGRDLVRGEVDLVAVVADTVSDAHAAGRDHAWRLELPENGAAVVVGDEQRLRQVLVNLLANARVHTPPGTTVTAALESRGDHVVVRVSDDGPGIAPELVPTLFDRFSRGDASRGRGRSERASTGLGLAIVEAIVTAHGGRIDVASEPGSTVFTVTLPVAP